MTITRTRIRCRERACPWPFDEEIHVPWCLGIEGTQHTREAQHQHHPKRSQGGKTIVAILCAYCHDRIDNGPWGNAVKEINGKRVYMIWDLHGEILYERIQEGRNDGSSSVRDEPDGALTTGGDDRVPSDGLHVESLGVGATGEGESSTKGQRVASVPQHALPSPAAPAPSDDGEASQASQAARYGGNDSGSETGNAVETAAPEASPPSPGARAPEQAGRERGSDSFPGSAIQPQTPPSFSTQEDKDERHADSRAGSDDGGRGDTAPSMGRPRGVAPYSFGENGIEWEPEFTFDDWARAAERVKTESVGRHSQRTSSRLL